MALIHIIKNSTTEAVLKCYRTDSAGGNVDITIASLALPNETVVAGRTKLTIKSIYWGAKKDKQIDITRIVPTTSQPDGEWDPSGVHSHYYLLNSGYYEFKGFVDNVYGGKDIRIVGDGPFHVTLVLGKDGYTITDPYVGSI